MNKAGFQKHLPIKWTVEIYKIYKQFRSTDANALAYYGLKDSDDDIVETTEDHKPFRFKESDLLQVYEENRNDDTITTERADFMNNYLQRSKQRRAINE